MNIVTQTAIYKRTLAEQKGKAAKSDPDPELRSQLHQAFERFRVNAGKVADQIYVDLKFLTVHNLPHIDALWQIADIIIGDGYPFTPTEAFVLGGAFLLHDLGMALASYQSGAAEIEAEPAWKDAAAQRFRRKHGRSPKPDELQSLEPELKQAATEEVLRWRHAEQAATLAAVGYRHAARDDSYYLIEDQDLRRNYGPLIGEIAYSHWWAAEELPGRFDKPIGAYPGAPTEWTVDPLKIALVLRVADACHLDQRRAPGLLRALRKPTGESEKHWRFQEYVQLPARKNGRVVFSATRSFPIEDFEAWWLGYELIGLADRELQAADRILRDTGRPPFAVHSVAGAHDPRALTRFFPTAGWKPVSTTIKVGDVAGLVRNLGGRGLYGDTWRVPLRELIQNARDAIVARRHRERMAESWGEIAVRLLAGEDGHAIEVRDNGVGMSEAVLIGPLLDFGISYWNSPLMAREHPGLASSGFEPQGRYGIGFFSVFMWGDGVKVVTRTQNDGIEDTRVLEFRHGLLARPILRLATPAERLTEPGTVVRVSLERDPHGAGGLLAPEPITTRLGRKSSSKRWTLRELCEWLCPALDVNLKVEHGGASEAAVLASDWKTLSGPDLLRRLMLHHEDTDIVRSDAIFRDLADRICDVRTDDGSLIGRGVIVPFLGNTIPEKHPYRESSVVTAGSFRARDQMDFVGLLLGRPEGPSRFAARPLIDDNPLAVSRWATTVAAATLRGARPRNLTARAFYDLYSLAMRVRVLGGDTLDLPIARRGLQEFLSFNDIAHQADLPDEVELHPDAWGIAGWVPGTLPTNQIGVASGRMKPLSEFRLDSDPRHRSDHPEWRRYWMGLWGAVIEAIATAWGAPLQEVLEASEIAKNDDMMVEERDGRAFRLFLTDKIRKPRVLGSGSEDDREVAP